MLLSSPGLEPARFASVADGFNFPVSSQYCGHSSAMETHAALHQAKQPEIGPDRRLLRVQPFRSDALLAILRAPPYFLLHSLFDLLPVPG